MLTPRLLIPALLALLVLCGVAVWQLLPGPNAAPGIAVEDMPAPEPPAERTEPPVITPERPEPEAPEPEPEATDEDATGEELDEDGRRRARLARLQERLAQLQEIGAGGTPRIVQREDGTLELELDGVSSDELRRRLSNRISRPRLGSDPVAITLSGRVTDEAGRAVENVRIHVWPSAISKASDGNTERDILRISKPARDVMPPHDVERPGTSNYHLMAAGTVVAVTDASGFFHAEVEAARRLNTHAIGAMHLGIKPTKPGYAWRSNAEFNNVEPGARLEDIQLVVSRAAIIAGRVVDEEGKPVTRALVAVSRANDAEPDDGPLPGRAIYQDMRVNADGTFRFDAIQPGTWRVRAFCNSHQSIDGSRSVTLTSGSDVQLPDFVMRPASSLRVRVLGADGEPLAKTRITFHVRQTTGSETTRQLTTDENGEVTYTQIPVATMEVCISAPGYLPSAPYPLHPQGGEALDLGNVALIPAPPGSED